MAITRPRLGAKLPNIKVIFSPVIIRCIMSHQRKAAANMVPKTTPNTADSTVILLSFTINKTFAPLWEMHILPIVVITTINTSPIIYFENFLNPIVCIS